MIHIKRLTDGALIGKMEELFVFPGDTTPQQIEKYAAALTLGLDNHTTGLFVIAALDDTDALRGFIIAEDRGTCVGLSQAWSRPGNDFKIADAMFLRVQLWASALGRSRIQCETARSTTALFRRFGLEVERYVMGCTIDPTVLDLALSLTESTHG